MRRFVIPYLKKQMNNKDEVSATLASHDISQIDARYIKNSAIQASNKMVKEKVLNGESVTLEEQEGFTQAHAQGTKEGLQQQGNQRFFKPDEVGTAEWKDVFKDLEWEVEVDVTNENLDKDALTTLNTMMLTLAKNPELLNDPNMRMLWNKILRLTGAVSTLELASIPPPEPQQPQNRVSESMSYKDVPEDVKRQIEAQAGLKPSSITSPPVEQGSMVGQ
jgi:hypothetical protein